MSFRITDSSTSSQLAARISAARASLAIAQERIASGKRINRPSDDPSGAEAVIRLRTSQTEIAQFRRNAGLANDLLLAADVAVDDYQEYLDRARALLAQGASETTTPDARRDIAIELEGLRQQIRSLANTRHNDQFLFGGTRQNAPPFDTNFVQAIPAASAPLLQLEPASDPLAVGVTAETVFADSTGNIFDGLQTIITALRGTADPAADQAALLAGLDRLKSLADQASLARTRIGASLSHVTVINERLGEIFLDHQAAIERVEAADLAENAIALSEAQRNLEAILQSGNPARRRTLLDFLG
jgi:flagellar hook-associated protein 3 FlgL